MACYALLPDGDKMGPLLVRTGDRAVAAPRLAPAGLRTVRRMRSPDTAPRPA